MNNEPNWIAARNNIYQSPHRFKSNFFQKNSHFDFFVYELNRKLLWIHKNGYIYILLYYIIANHIDELLAHALPTHGNSLLSLQIMVLLGHTYLLIKLLLRITLRSSQCLPQTKKIKLNWNKIENEKVKKFENYCVADHHADWMHAPMNSFANFYSIKISCLIGCA